MTLSAKDYERAQSALSSGKLSDDDRAALLEAVEEFDNSHLAGQAGGGPADSAAPAPAQDAPPPELAMKLNPMMNLIPQALATNAPRTQPQATMRPQDSAMGLPGQNAVYVYEAPLKFVQQELMDKPELVPLLSPDGGIMTPEDIAKLGPSDSIVKSYNDYRWHQAKQDFEKGGREAVRYSQVRGGSGGVPSLDSLVGGLKPAMDAGKAFVLGVDEAATFGIGGQALKTLAPEGVSEGLEEAQREHPAAGGLGVISGALNPLAPSNALFSWIESAGKSALAPAGAGLIRQGLAHVAGTGAGAAGVQAAQEGVNAGGQAARGEATDLEGAQGRVAGAGALGAGIGAVAGGVGAALGGARNWIGEGPRYGGVPAQLERQGVNFKVGPGVELSPETVKAVEIAKARDSNPAAIGAEGLAPDVVKGARAEVDEAVKYVEGNQTKFYDSPEGKKAMRPQKLVQASVDQLSALHAPVEGKGLQPLSSDSPVTRQIKTVFADTIQAVRPGEVEGAVHLTPDQAKAFLSPKLKASLKRQVKEEDAQPTVISVIPRELNARQHEKLIGLIEGYKTPDGKTPDEIAKLDLAARQDRDLRPMNGQAGGWSAMQNLHGQRLEEAKALQRLATNNDGVEGATRVLAQHGKPAQNAQDMLTASALQKAADRGGVREELTRHRTMNRELSVRDASHFGAPVKGLGEPRHPLSPSGWFDALALRLAYPGLKGVTGQSMNRASRLAPAAVGQGSPQPEGVPQDLRGLPVSDPRVQDWLKGRKQATQ